MSVIEHRKPARSHIGTTWSWAERCLIIFLSTTLVLCGLTAMARDANASEAKTTSPDAKTSRLLLNGYRRYHSVCNHCHGPDGLGSSFGPSLIDTIPDPERFRHNVREGARGAKGVMNGFADNADVMQHLEAILAYIDARARGELGRGRPFR